MKKLSFVLVGCLVLSLGAVPAFAQSRPLATEDPEVVGAGQILFETGVDY